jgi:hypothetical protein
MKIGRGGRTRNGIPARMLASGSVIGETKTLFF